VGSSTPSHRDCQS